MMHQDHLEPVAIRFMLKCLQESAWQSGYFLPMYLYQNKHKNKFFDRSFIV